MTTTKIEWTDKVWNPVTGCTKVSEGCRHCYAERMAKRLRGRYGYPKDDPFKVTFHLDRLDEPLHCRKPQRIFVCSMGDLFYEDMPDSYIDQVFSVMALATQHTFMVLTKRPERMRTLDLFTHSGNCLWSGIRQAAEFLFDKDPGPMPKVLPNVYLGVSVEDQKTADKRVPLLLQTPAAKRFISIEPMLGPVDTQQHYWTATYAQWLDWVILGGESGPGARPMHPDWVRSVRDQCQAAGVPFFFKQWGGMGRTFINKRRNTCKTYKGYAEQKI